MNMEDPVCDVCGERKSAHVATDQGPHTHPREASGEGHYEQISPGGIHGGFFPGEEYEVPPRYRFVPKASAT